MNEILGLVAGALIAVAFVPQVWRLFSRKSAHDISLPFTLLFISGILFWIGYGISQSLLAVILWNAVMFVLLCTVLYAKLRYGRI